MLHKIKGLMIKWLSFLVMKVLGWIVNWYLVGWEREKKRKEPCCNIYIVSFNYPLSSIIPSWLPPSLFTFINLMNSSMASSSPGNCFFRLTAISVFPAWMWYSLRMTEKWGRVGQRWWEMSFCWSVRSQVGVIVLCRYSEKCGNTKISK